ncbi:MAG: hypothetical protein WCS65_14805 [Verrucomicrobiae bacterium]
MKRTLPLSNKIVPIIFVLTVLALAAVGKAHAGQVPAVFDFSKLTLVEKIDCASVPPPDSFRQFPEGASKVETVLGRKCRTLPNDSDLMKYFAYKIGQGKGLKPGAAYLLVVDYPEDRPRTMYVLNRGNETGRGLATGSAVADGLFGRYVSNNPESVAYPLAEAWQQWQHFFYLHDRFPGLESLRGAKPRPVKPEEGFWVMIAQTNQSDAAGSAGAAASSISLYEVPNPGQYDVKINYPPGGLPKRYLFCREEMADGVISVPHGPDNSLLRGLDNPVTWYEYKARNMQFLGMNTFANDLLEFGHNQGWDAKDNAWYVPSSQPGLWGKILAMLKSYPSLFVLPYYEYGGGTGPDGEGRKSKPLMLNGGKKYTHLDWINKNAHVDILDPAALDDAKRLLDATILPFKDEVKFLGAWFRPRPVQMPISFRDENLALYQAETGVSATREDLKSSPEGLQKYCAWWLQKREAFVAALAQYLRSNGLPEALVLLTPDSSEPGVRLPDDVLVTDDAAAWGDLLSKLPKKKSVASLESVVRDGRHLKALTTPVKTWGDFEWQHASPQADPENYQGSRRGALLTYTFNRLYTVSSPKAFDAFRTGEGLAVVRHHSLNENIMDDKIGYFACDVEAAGPYSMLSDARAVAYGDPRFIGYLISNTLARGFPQYAREFNRAFLALPALPGKLLDNGSSDKEVVVRVIDAGPVGTYLAVVNTGLSSKQSVAVKLPNEGSLVNSALNTPLPRNGDKLLLDFYPGQLYALLIKPLSR